MYRASNNYWQHVVTYRVVSDNFILFVHITHTEQHVRILASGRDKKYTYVMYICYLVTKMSLFILLVTFSVYSQTQNLCLQFFSLPIIFIYSFRFDSEKLNLYYVINLFVSFIVNLETISIFSIRIRFSDHTVPSKNT